MFAIFNAVWLGQTYEKSEMKSHSYILIFSLHTSSYFTTILINSRKLILRKDLWSPWSTVIDTYCYFITNLDLYSLSKNLLRVTWIFLDWKESIAIFCRSVTKTQNSIILEAIKFAWILISCTVFVMLFFQNVSLHQINNFRLVFHIGRPK